MRALSALLLALCVPVVSLAVGPRTPKYVPSESECLPPAQAPPVTRPVEHPAADDPASPWMSMPMVASQVPAAELRWDEAVHSRDNGTVRSRDHVLCPGPQQTEAPTLRASPFDVSPPR